MNISQRLPGQEFWSAAYCGRQIAMLNRSGRWHVYLDHVLQHSVVFATADQAVAWLMTRIDDEFLGLVHASRGRNGQQCLDATTCATSSPPYVSFASDGGAHQSPPAAG